ncbi:MAG TPA: hypothetical protein VLU92_00665, partial [Candidatus Dormibacteraeota bacterium]|nr:hypothetical protein [Candidatus Dormibacteraeota bacterium]
MRRLVVVALLAISCGALPAHAQTLTLAYRSGDTFKYAIHSVLKENLSAAGVTIPLDIEMTGHETVKVTSVDSSGTSDMAITVSDVTMKTVSKWVTNTTSYTPASSVEVKVSSDGRVRSVNGISTTGNVFATITNLGGGFITAVLPDNAVKPGDSWTKSYDEAGPDGSGAAHITAASKYLRDESVSGVSTAVVETKSTTSIDFTTSGGSLKPAGGTNASPMPMFPIGNFQGVSIKGTIVSD